MNFELSEEHLMIQKMARDFAVNELLPGVIERDEHQIMASDYLKKMGELGLMGMMVDPKYGGSGMDTLSYVIAMTEISKIDNSCSVAMSVNNSLVCYGLEKYGTEEQKEKYLKPLASGEKLGAFLSIRARSGFGRYKSENNRSGYGRLLSTQWD
jgi:alkylation response protein AidB-like acyl-CoA dehydrogenase